MYEINLTESRSHTLQEFSSVRRYVLVLPGGDRNPRSLQHQCGAGLDSASLRRLVVACRERQLTRGAL